MNLKCFATDDRYIGLQGLTCGIVGITTDIVLRYVGLEHAAEGAGLIVAATLVFIAVNKRLLRFPWFWCLVVAMTT